MGVTVPGTEVEAGLSKGLFRAPRGTQISCKGWRAGRVQVKSQLHAGRFALFRAVLVDG
jgi:hypothetical protein